jgi:hypothetical protein
MISLKSDIRFGNKNKRHTTVFPVSVLVLVWTYDLLAPTQVLALPVSIASVSVIVQRSTRTPTSTITSDPHTIRWRAANSDLGGVDVHGVCDAERL